MIYVLLLLVILFGFGLVKQHFIILNLKDAIARAHVGLLGVIQTQNATKKDVIAVTADLKKWI